MQRVIEHHIMQLQLLQLRALWGARCAVGGAVPWGMPLGRPQGAEGLEDGTWRVRGIRLGAQWSRQRQGAEPRGKAWSGGQRTPDHGGICQPHKPQLAQLRLLEQEGPSRVQRAAQQGRAVARAVERCPAPRRVGCRPPLAADKPHGAAHGVVLISQMRQHQVQHRLPRGSRRRGTLLLRRRGCCWCRGLHAVQGCGGKEEAAALQARDCWSVPCKS